MDNVMTLADFRLTEDDECEAHSKYIMFVASLTAAVVKAGGESDAFDGQFEPWETLSREAKLELLDIEIPQDIKAVLSDEFPEDYDPETDIVIH